jgi:nucleotide-binding universal stress UspA family protein
MSSTGTLLVPLDGSEKDARALAVAAALAELSGAALYLVHVLDHLAPGVETDRARQRAADQRLEESAGSVATRSHVEVHWGVLTSGDVVGELLRQATVQDVIAVVMGTRAPNVAERVLAGSVADRVIHECTRPVVLVPPGTAYMAGKRIRFGRVLVPLDGSRLAEQALDFFVQLRHANALEYVLLTVVPPPHAQWVAGADAGVSGSAELRAAETWLERVAARGRAHGVATIETRFAEGTNPAETIAAAVREYLVEMIVMSTRGLTGLRRLMLGSVAEAVIRASEMPVLLLTPAMLARMHGSASADR